MVLRDPVTLGLTAVVSIGAIDVLTGQEFAMSHFYVLSVVYVAWCSQRVAALVVAITSACTGVLADHLLSEPYLRFGTSFESELIPSWNGASRLVVYVLTAYFVAALRNAIRERDQLIDSLQSASASIRRLEGLLPLCAWCRNIRDEARGGKWVPLEAYIESHTDMHVSHGICPECAERVKQEHSGAAPK